MVQLLLVVYHDRRRNSTHYIHLTISLLGKVLFCGVFSPALFVFCGNLILISIFAAVIQHTMDTQGIVSGSVLTT